MTRPVGTHRAGRHIGAGGGRARAPTATSVSVDVTHANRVHVAVGVHALHVTAFAIARVHDVTWLVIGGGGRRRRTGDQGAGRDPETDPGPFPALGFRAAGRSHRK